MSLGRVLAFLDAHVEVNHNWLEPLLEAVTSNPTRIALPHIDRLSPHSLTYKHWTPQMHGSFDWTMEYVWKRIPDLIESQRKSAVEPILTPTTIGCTFVINRIYFFELGAFDEGMLIWGGENVELSFRTWMCGGSMYIYPCSVVAHIFRRFLPYEFPFQYGGGDIVRKNYQRIAEIWMDEYKLFYYAATKEIFPFSTKKERYTLEHRKAIRRKLSCKTFKWYLQNIAKDVVLPRMDSNVQGQVKSASFQRCLTADPVSGFLTFSPCDRVNKDQYFSYTNQSLIVHNNTHCLSVRRGKEVPVVVPCNPSDSDQHWIFTEGNSSSMANLLYYRDVTRPVGRIHSVSISYCLSQVTVEGSAEQVPGYVECNQNEYFQLWVFSYKFDFGRKGPS